MKKVFKLGIFGLTPHEQNTLESIVKLAYTRERCYRLLSSKERKKADIILVDMDDPDALTEWRYFNKQYNTIPVIGITKELHKTTSGSSYLYRPLTLKRVLETLDEVTIKVLKYTLITIDDTHIIDEVTRATLERAVLTTLQPGTYKALVIDDALAVRKNMEIQLGIFGIALDFAETGEEALVTVEKNLYDIIFLDLILPGVDGYQVCKTLKMTEKTKNIPIIILTGKGGFFNKLRGTLVGANAYLTKPVQQEQLKTVIQQVLPQIDL